jgi:GT2 family glycosyltransferase
MTRVSVIIPTYNRKEYVQEAIESVLAQSITDNEIIVIDDGSTDGTSQALSARYGSGICYQWQENQGESVARNVGIKLAHGEYIAFLDSDDVWLPDKLANQIEFLESNGDVHLVFCQAFAMNESGEVDNSLILGGSIKPADLCLENMIRENTVSAGGSTVVLRRDLLLEVGGFDPAIRYGEDWDLWLRLRMHTTFGFMPLPLAHVRIHQGTQSYFPDPDRVERMLKDRLYILAKVQESQPDAALEPIIEQAMAKEHLLASFSYLSTGDDGRALEQLGSTAHTSPSLLMDPSFYHEALWYHARLLDENEDAIAFARKALEQRQRVAGTPGHDDAKILARVYAWRGAMAYDRCDLATAREYLGKGIASDPSILRDNMVYAKLPELLLGERLASHLREAKRRLIPAC